MPRREPERPRRGERAQPAHRIGERTATMIALAYSMGGLGAFTAAVPLELALRHFDWRQIFHVLAAATLVLAAVFTLLFPQHPGMRRATPLGGLFARLAQIGRDPAVLRVAPCPRADQ